ncbi:MULTISPECIES: hypothetical protein [Kitasatospora]|uniref:Serine/arginine repetitive matrix protein 2 n=1 Tax=Kitasatospora cathayae TaxID=3004092 RepID=A0ABY7Q3U8_9ACTN|nr:hypothetical protein [Kitasatospora sp. HUAS 3-15]WBP86901.1 hypothetical protein O1G21_14375 [Kitasatospora sp. HUAS 3-15]
MPPPLAPPLLGPRPPYGPPPQRPSARPRSRRVLVAVVAGALAGLLAGGGWYLLNRDGGRDRPVTAASGPASPTVSESASPAPTGTSVSVAPAPPDTPVPSLTPTPTSTPAGPHLTPVQDPSGFTLLVPDGWQRRTQDSAVFYDSPDGASLIEVWAVGAGSPYQQAADTDGELARNATRFPNYHRIRLEQAADGSAELEYAYDHATSGSGVRHAIDHILVGPDGSSWAVLVAGPEQSWPTPLHDLLQSELASFCLAGHCP